MDMLIGFFEWLVDFLKDNFLFIVFCIVAALFVGLLVMVIVPSNTTSEEINTLKDNCEFIAYGQYSDTLVDFRLQRCIVPDGVCYVSSGGGVDCKWEEEE